MKPTFVSCVLLIFSVMAQANVIANPLLNCEGQQDCQVVIVPKEIIQKGQCRGMFEDNLPCTVTYEVSESETKMNLNCGEVPGPPVINLDLAAEATSYNVVTLKKNEKGETSVVSDDRDYTLIKSSFVELLLVEEDKGAGMEKQATVSVTSEETPILFKDVSCL